MDQTFVNLDRPILKRNHNKKHFISSKQQVTGYLTVKLKQPDTHHG